MGEPAESVEDEVLAELRDLRAAVERLTAVTDELLRRRARRAPQPRPSRADPDTRSDVYRRMVNARKKAAK